MQQVALPLFVAVALGEVVVPGLPGFKRRLRPLVIGFTTPILLGVGVLEGADVWVSWLPTPRLSRQTAASFRPGR